MALRFRGLDAPIEVVYRKSSGSAPQAVDPYQQAAAQYGLATGTAAYNAGLNRPNTVNPLGSTTWSVSNAPSAGSYAPPASGIPGPQARPQPVIPASDITGRIQTQKGGGLSSLPGDSAHSGTAGGGNPLSASNLTNPSAPFIDPRTGIPNYGAGQTDPYAGVLANELGTPPPSYTQTTSLTPWANQELSSPIDTQGLPGMPGGPSITQNLADTQGAIYNQQMAYLKPQQELAAEQLQSQLAAQGITPGSAAYKNAMDQQARGNTFTNQQAINAAITGGNQEQATLYGLGTQGLQNQIALRNAPINEFNALQGAGAGGGGSAMTPDITGAFNQQLQSQLANYNANVASNNATTGAASSLLASYLMYLALA